MPEAWYVALWDSVPSSVKGANLHFYLLYLPPSAAAEEMRSWMKASLATFHDHLDTMSLRLCGSRRYSPRPWLPRALGEPWQASGSPEKDAERTGVSNASENVQKDSCLVTLPARGLGNTRLFGGG